MFSFVFKWRTASVLWLMTWCCFSLNHANKQANVSTPTSVSVCDGYTATLTCNISQSNGVAPTWRVFTTSDTSGIPVVSLDPGQNSPPFNYPTIQAGDIVARLEVNASSTIAGYHFQCRLYIVPHTDSPGTGNITVIGIPSCLNGVELDSSTLGNNGCDVSLSWQQPPNTPPVTSTTVTYCPTSSPNCGDSMNCTSPCTISGLDPDTEYQFTVIPNNNCGSPIGCTGNTVTHYHVSCLGTARTNPTDDLTLTSGTSAGCGVKLSTVLVLFCLVALLLRFS